jgi:peptide-methionine (S)-S-oxide reductase
MTPNTKPRRPLLEGALAAALMGGLLFLTLAAPGRLGLPPASAARAERTEAVTAPPPRGREVATFAAGCFWSMEAIFKRLKGVERVDPGYSGGSAPHPSYEQVETGTTGYAEAANITFDPRVISYRDLLRVLLTVRDPTTPNQQGPDRGPQYRSVIFYRSPAQKRAAEQALREVSAARVWPDPVVTEVRPFTSFYRAEGYHLDYYNRHPNEDYCQYVIAPEIAAFRAKFADKLKR